MNNEIKKRRDISLSASIIIVAVLAAGALVYTVRIKNQEEKRGGQSTQLNGYRAVSPKDEIELPARFGNLGAQMVEAGVIDKEKFENLYKERGGLNEADRKLLTDGDNGNLVITPENAGVILNMLWAFGLANKNPILENSPMADERYGGTGNFASTGGWNLADGGAMNHYNMHRFVTLTEKQQALVERVAKNIYRPCCNNSTYFPDCNHGMAMLGLLELMASGGTKEADMYKAALRANILWFPNEYKTIETFFASQNTDWNAIDPKKILGADYSSASGYQKILLKINPPKQKGGASCGA